jgi:hypothetical protein
MRKTRLAMSTLQIPIGVSRPEAIVAIGAGRWSAGIAASCWSASFVFWRIGPKKKSASRIWWSRTGIKLTPYNNKIYTSIKKRLYDANELNIVVTQFQNGSKLLVTSNPPR